MKELTDNWNLQTLRWLRITVFDRTPKSVAVFAVFFVSVLWHGFYPGYYLFFVSMAWFSVVRLLLYVFEREGSSLNELSVVLISVKKNWWTENRLLS